MTTVKTLLKGTLVLAVTVSLFSFNEAAGWFKAGSAADSYDMGIDQVDGREGKNVGTIKSNTKKIKGFGTLMQNSLPDKYIGKRVRMSAFVKTENVSNWAGIWFRIDELGTTQSLGFDNMRDGKEDRSIKGRTDWTKYDIVLDVPANTSNLAYGALLVGTGQIWFDDITFEIVDTTVQTTGIDYEERTILISDEPTNLDFEK